MDTSKEKHVPVIELVPGGVKVKVGAVAHPVDEKHYIEWFEVLAGERVLRQFLNPGDAPEAEFSVGASRVVARAYCTLHGHWKA